MARYRHIFQSLRAFPAQCSQACVNHCRLLDQLGQSFSWNRNGRSTGCKFGQSGDISVSRNLPSEDFPTERSSGRSVFVGRCDFWRQDPGSFFLLVSVLVLLLASISGASRVSYRLEAGKDLTYLTNASANAERREGIDSSLRKYSFMALSRARTGIVYNVTLPPYFDGITAQAIRLRYGSLRKRGLIFNEFTIPVGAIVTGGPVVVLIYRKIFNFTVYSLPTEYDFAGPVVGIVAYAPANISLDDTPFPEANFTSPNSPIVVHVPISQSIGRRVPLCAFFGLDGSVVLRNLSSLPNVCTSVNLGDVSLVVPATQTPPATHPAPPPATPSIKRPSAKRKASNSWKIALVATFGAIAGLVLLGVLAVFGPGVYERIRIAIMERFADHDEPLQTALIGQSRAPTAAGVRTRPTLETDKFLAGSSQL